MLGRVVYGAVAMSVSVYVFSYLQEREELEDKKMELAERRVSTEMFFQAMEKMPHLSAQDRIEMLRFWRNLIKRQHNLRQRSSTDKRGRVDPEDETMQDHVVVHDVHRFAQEYKRVFPDRFPEKQVLEAVEHAAEDAAVRVPNAWTGLVDGTSTMLLSTGKRLNEIAKGTKDEVQFAMHRTVRNVLERALDIVAARLKEKVKDPDMPEYLKTNIDVGIEQFMPDVKMEIFRKTRDLFGTDATVAKTRATIETPRACPRHGTVHVDPPSTHTIRRFRHVRGHILHHLFPHNKTIWRSLKDPWWILYTSMGLLPVLGQLWWLILFLLKDKTNEHQLCQFIVGFKAAQFITLGVLHMMAGVVMYVMCTVQGSMLACQEGAGPALSAASTGFFVVQIVLVWAAFFRLPYTERPQEQTRFRSQSIDEREHGVFHDAFGNAVHLDRGGYLMKCCGYETVSLVVIVALAALVLWLPFELWQRQALFYWIRTTYGLLSFPFLIFKVPVIATVLMHTRQMGYNEQGQTVPFAVEMHGE
ncbi:hypothetical protein PsorP6_005535 [Peronosclerospora sorghi]|uniref:Uncharacterized protein n=1 Tax=Peronosclerospora sorghi TaxID=230839 RepID=A0ACC0W584_9STRA|nr:hypothetical protein PsorP6_005535 [Peronosclerospora sorghi]